MEYMPYVSMYFRINSVISMKKQAIPATVVVVGTGVIFIFGMGAAQSLISFSDWTSHESAQLQPPTPKSITGVR